MSRGGIQEHGKGLGIIYLVEYPTILVPTDKPDNVFPCLHGLKRKKSEKNTKVGKLVGNGREGVDEGDLRLIEEIGQR